MRRLRCTIECVRSQWRAFWRVWQGDLEREAGQIAEAARLVQKEANHRAANRRQFRAEQDEYDRLLRQYRADLGRYVSRRKA